MSKGSFDGDEELATLHTPLLQEFARVHEDAGPPPAPSCQCYVLGLVLGTVFLTDLANSVSKAPLMRVFESIICQNHYAGPNAGFIGRAGNVDEQHCKISPVQQELALLRAWLDFFDYLPGLFLAIPFGMLADKYGRKWLNVLNTASLWLRLGWICLVCAFPHLIPLRLIWAQSILGVFGGGPVVGSALSMVIMTDVTPESKRATVFFYAHAALCATEFFGPPVSSVLMGKSPWIALALAICLLTLAISLAIALPETISNSRDTNRPSLVNCRPQSSLGQHLNESLTSNVSRHLPALGFLVSDHRVGFILFISISFIFGQACANLTLQYTSRRYKWTLSKAAYLSSIKAAFMLVTLLGLLPLASSYLLRRKSFTPLKKDVLLLRISSILVTIGYSIEGIASSTPFFVVGYCLATMGLGATALIRSLLASLVKKDEVGRLFMMMSLVWTAAMLVASPAVALLFREGLERKGMWAGLPFVTTGVIFAAATTATYVINLKGSTTAELEARLEDETQIEREKDRHQIRQLSWTPRTPSFRPSNLILKSSRPPDNGMLTSPAWSQTPLFSPGLHIASPHDKLLM
ncbi:MAG: hypothetical protein Q9191_007459 [Dirinaria sp. TL-2023a]